MTLKSKVVNCLWPSYKFISRSQLNQACLRHLKEWVNSHRPELNAPAAAATVADDMVKEHMIETLRESLKCRILGGKILTVSMKKQIKAALKAEMTDILNIGAIFDYFLALN